MNELCITDAAKQFDVTSKTLRYYERVGLLKAKRADNNNYRYYDESEVERIKQIIILRKMQISIKDIVRIYESQDMSTVVEVFVNRIQSLDEEVGALSKLRRIINDFLQTMINNGITKISALPLIYAKMDKKLEILEERRPVTYKELAVASEKLVKPMNIRVINIPSMRVLSSYLKESNRNQSTRDEFLNWISKNIILQNPIGEYKSLDFIDMITGQDVHVEKIPDNFINDTPYMDFVFQGGTFAAHSIILGEDDLGEAWNQQFNYIENEMTQYELDRVYIKHNRFDSLGASILSEFVDKERYDVLMPLQVRYNNVVEINHIDIVHLKEQIKIINKKSIDIKNELKPLEKTECYFSDFLNIISNGRESSFETVEKFILPIQIDVCGKISDTDFRLYYNYGEIILNWSSNKDELRIHDPYIRRINGYPGKGRIPENEFIELSWIISENLLAVIVNDEIRHLGTNYVYMQNRRLKNQEFPIRIGTHSSSTLTIKSMAVSQIKEIKNIKKILGGKKL